MEFYSSIKGFDKMCIVYLTSAAEGLNIEKLNFTHYKQNTVSQTDRMKWDKTHKQKSLDEMKKVSTSAPLSDGRMERCELKRTSEGQSCVTHLACLSGLSNSEGQRWEQNRKEGTVLSQAGRARQVREPSVRQKQRQIVPFFVTVL